MACTTEDGVADNAGTNDDTSSATEDDWSDADWDEWEREGFYIPPSYRESQNAKKKPAADQADLTAADNVVADEIYGADTPAWEADWCEAREIDKAFEFVEDLMRVQTRNKETAEAQSQEKERLSPAERIFGVYELCENVLGHLPTKDIFRLRGLCTSVKTTIAYSKTLKTKLFLMPDNSEKPV
ncbi:hypothetical protein CLAFUW4_03937 [Fulvia fulva]|uniref:Uncharacterized protein n=1 Tax=Passalora fulva TaxID=5499 RepID=A0A9Q8LGG1_PASFU|nr:uncharacterized protein CLAFUR5_03905 [Fulvia fulva]KAK4626756.1 hypothetical protein CLAFUR4_03923 [Fulvia fulva]KAK4628479.1 hypothetical protein CLAFUR0_03924 [Fulvia fulva]UJO16945.1 hypothetical protein CLAFUR5_03905 [Fulvia fulva]WPV14337.1 hypothetical protein CLAFUW4_03937 [Fulvia fulva]WPV28225.1 hypothetical protein CLAFUW7_03926 [Fulvia fulva]